MEKLEEGDFHTLLFFVAIMALHDAISHVYHMK